MYAGYRQYIVFKGFDCIGVHHVDNCGAINDDDISLWANTLDIATVFQTTRDIRYVDWRNVTFMVGARCRFDRSSANRGTCIFPCRCTKGCDHVTGQCLDNGQCSDGQPSGYNWRGTACQIGNVALNKTTTQSTAKWGGEYPASQAVDGAIDMLSYQHCSIPNANSVSNVWWNVDFGRNYKISGVVIYNSDTDAQPCPAIDVLARVSCGAVGISELDCRVQGCCWDGEARDSDIACYRKQCKEGYFGWRCRFHCHKCSICDSVTGECQTTCQDDRWGVGCLLSNNCYYDDEKGFKYTGRTNSENSFTCLKWTNQTRKVDNKFPEGSRAAAKNYCRNPDHGSGPWCYYYDNNNVHMWHYCDVYACACDSRRFGVNCEKECHCKNIGDNCQRNTPKGRCQSGCASHFTGSTCQECKDGHFGEFCDATCHCQSGSCDKKTGHCPSGCAVGWAGNNCQKDERRLSAFTLSVGNSSDIEDHTQCARHNGAVAAGETVNESCSATGRYLSFRRSGGGDDHWTTLCEVVVIGHRYISCQLCPSTCSDIIGCDACAPGKQQPDCVYDCDDGSYGINLLFLFVFCRLRRRILRHQLVIFVRFLQAATTDHTASTCYSYCDDGSYGINCNESCGHCKLQSNCFIGNGSCPNGCEPWYISDVCKTYIATPGFYPPVKPDVDNVTSSSAAVSWSRASNISAGFEDHYHYILRLRVDGGSETNMTRVEQGAGEQRVETQITGLTSNTAYSLRVEPFRQLNGEREGGASTGVVRFKTKSSVYREPLGGGGLSGGATAGVVIGVIVFIAGVSSVGAVVFLRRRRSGKGNRANVAIDDIDRSVQGAGQDNGVFEDVRDAEDEDVRDVEDEDVRDAEDEGADDESIQDPTAIYANTQQVSRGIKLAALAAYVEDKKHHNGFKKEFDELPSGVRAKCTAAHKQNNKNKNRFVNIIAYDHTRVVLPTDNGPSDYINANHIMGYKEKANAYLATQGPKDWTIEDVWRMVWQEKTNTVVMLANLYELGKEKCSRYWPEKGKTQTWGHFIAESISEEQFADYVIREFTLKNQELKKMRKIRQLHFTAWPDKGTPEYAYPLLAFHRKVHSFDSERRGPLLVHCSAGVGRTGTFIAIDILIQQAAAEGKVDIFNCVNLLRTQRMDMVQTLAQYVFVFQALVDTSEDSVIPCYQLTQSFNELCQGNKLYEQFKRLNALKTLTKNHTSAALQPNNVEKNRIIEIIPDDQHRPYLVTPWKEGTNYINAVCVHGYKQRNAYILTQSPMTTTVVDMWRLLNDHESRAVIMLDDIDVTDDPGDGATVVRQFHLKRNSWNKDESVPSNKTVLLDLLDMVEKWQQQSGNKPITLHCSDGAGRCGVVCAASYILEHLKIEQEVDVFHAVQHIRTTRPQLITDLAQYRFLYQVALAFMSQFDTYANFQ
ncbi:hypothetical protein LSAT2_024929 [Lamellibrachia satsuma]|nr:hypothetical protein LSAT2_024929 [Lamellibrachia satsuma]